ncbi:cyclic nucleotide-binding protein [Sesbania bispinosa]|nr:cyclic nucleotide-binding protein [Sesbania bispinosa]
MHAPRVATKPILQRKDPSHSTDLLQLQTEHITGDNGNTRVRRLQRLRQGEGFSSNWEITKLKS